MRTIFLTRSARLRAFLARWAPAVVTIGCFAASGAMIAWGVQP